MAAKLEHQVHPGTVLENSSNNLIGQQVMASKVTFVNQNNKAQSFKVNLFGPARNRIKVVNVLAVFKASVVVMGDGSIMEADDSGLSMDTFKAGSTYTIAIVPIQG
jgi:hypothetical protein